MVDSLSLIAAFGNPLWDVCISLPDRSVLTKFDLADDSSMEVTAPEYESLLSAVDNYYKQVCPGGAALNTLRVFQWLCGRVRTSVFFGGIGDDDTGKCLQTCVSQSGVDGRFKIHKDLLTGSAICLIYEKLRTLVAHLGAANVYGPGDLTFDDKRIITEVQLMYIENFFFCHSYAVIWDVVELCKTHGVAIIFNLSGSYLLAKHATEIATLVRCANVVIGNESEFEALALAVGWEHLGINALAMKISADGIMVPSSVPSNSIRTLRQTNLEEFGKVVIVTRGNEPVLCAHKQNSIFETEVLKPKSEVVDTTGAGDAFAAGILMGIIQKISLSECVQLACYAASEIIQQIGCSPPEHSPLQLGEILRVYRNQIFVENSDS